MARKGVINKLDSAPDLFTQRRMMHAGGEPLKGEVTNSLIHWRNLIAQRDDCARRIKAGEGTEHTSKQHGQLYDEIVETWQQLGVELEKLDAGNWQSERLSKTFALLAKAARPAVFLWQKLALTIVQRHVLSEGGASQAATPA